MKEALENLGLRAAGGNYKALAEACARHGLDVPRFDYRGLLDQIRRQRPDDEVFVEGSDYTSREGLKRRLYRLGVPKQCEACGLGPSWNGKPLSLTLEHRNGVWNDNRRANLAILCPNCHSQTDTFAGGSLSLRCECGARKGKRSRLCVACTRARGNPSRMKVDWPDLNELEEMVERDGYSAVGRSLGVSDNAVRKALRRMRDASPQ